MSETANEPAVLDGSSHAELLNVLARAEPQGVKRFAEALIPALGEIEVLASRTGLVMLPMRDTAKGAAFHLGEVLVAEAHVRGDDQEGYGMRRGRDLDAAMAMALIDLAVAQGVGHGEIDAYIAAEAGRQAAEDDTRLRAVEATRVDMETF